jgi:hypothetical protein
VEIRLTRAQAGLMFEISPIQRREHFYTQLQYALLPNQGITLTVHWQYPVVITRLRTQMTMCALHDANISEGEDKEIMKRALIPLAGLIAATVASLFGPAVANASTTNAPMKANYWEDSVPYSEWAACDGVRLDTKRTNPHWLVSDQCYERSDGWVFLWWVQ